MQSNQHIQDIKDRLPIEEVVSRYVKLEKSGINLKGLCPFHTEKSPSFFVAPHRGSFMCFGCGKKGDVFTFVQEIEGIEFFDALKKLAEEAGVEIKTTHQEKKQEYNAYTLLEKACLFFEHNLKNSIDVQNYLEQRGLHAQTISQFRIGYIADEWNLLYTELLKNFTEKEIEESGLIVKNDTGKKYDRFRGRIMFPIFDSNGKVVAFTGRVFNSKQDNAPKYVNSPETALFSKSHILYGLNFAKQTIRKNNFVILAEGQMDVIMSHQIGYSNTVASSGTAFTQDQLQLISKQTHNLLLAFDSDSAGLNTTSKVWEMAIAQGLDVKIAYYEGAKDPADTIKENPDEWKRIIKESIHIIEFITHLVAKISDERKRIKAYQEKIIPLLKRVHSFGEKNYFVEKISALLLLNPAIIWSDISLSTTPEYQRQHYVIPEKINYDILISTYVEALKNQFPIIEKSVNDFFQSFGLEMYRTTEVDDKKLFELEDDVSTNLEITKNNFKELLSQYVVTMLRLKNREMRATLHLEVTHASDILKNIETNKKRIASILENDCQFINNMV